jgi:uncharacterized protein (DUF488 family)
MDQLLDLMHAHDLRHLVDVRRYPGSRRYPQFSREHLETVVSAGGLSYRHEPELGGRRQPLVGSLNTAWRNDQFRGYADYAATEPFRTALDRLVMESAAEPTVIMCAEAVPWRCHRRLIADYLAVRGHQAIHIIGPGRVEVHVLNTDAVERADGVLIYPGTLEGQLDLLGDQVDASGARGIPGKQKPRRRPG